MDYLLKRAKGLYIDRQRIALAAIMIAFSVSLFLFYNLGILSSFSQPPPGSPIGSVSGYDAVIALNAFGLTIACILMVLAFLFWTWAFLPSPASIYTMGILHGIFGSKVKIQRRIGKRFRILLDERSYIDILCKIKERQSDEWFIYQLTSSSLEGKNLREIALRHGMSVRKNRFTTWVSSNELHHRLILFTKALNMVNF